MMNIENEITTRETQIAQLLERRGHALQVIANTQQAVAEIDQQAVYLRGQIDMLKAISAGQGAAEKPAEQASHLPN